MRRACATAAALLVIGTVCAVGGSGQVVGTTVAQPGSSVTLVGANVTVDVGEPHRVNATYRFRATDPRSLATLNGTMWRFPDHEVGTLRSSIDGMDVATDVTREARHMRVSVPVPADARDGTVSVRVHYQVDGPAGRLRLPLWVPTASTPGSDRVIRVRVLLPAGTQVQSTTFPEFDSRAENSSVITARLPQMPGLVALRYGPGPPGFTLDSVLGFGAIGVLGCLGAAWAVVRHREGEHVA